MVAIAEDSIRHNSAVDLCTVCAVQVLQDEILAIMRDSSMLPRYFAVIQSNSTAHAATDHGLMRGIDFKPTSSIGTIDDK